MTVATAERFVRYWSRNNSTGCWEWTGANHSQGYGHFRLDGKTQLAHRVSWVLANGEIPDRMVVRHRCDNPKCVNPSHLFLGTQQDNTLDCISKGRGNRVGSVGSANGRSVLSENQVRIILRDRRAIKEIADEYECAVSTISMIKNGRNWSHLFMEWQSENATKRAEMRL